MSHDSDMITYEMITTGYVYTQYCTEYSSCFYQSAASGFGACGGHTC